MSKFGFDAGDDKFDLGELPKSRRVSPTKVDSSIVRESEELGFSDRSGLKQASKRRPGRKKRDIERGQVLITGPANIIEEFKRYCIENGDIAYWEGIQQLLRKN